MFDLLNLIHFHLNLVYVVIEVLNLSRKFDDEYLLFTNNNDGDDEKHSDSLKICELVKYSKLQNTADSLKKFESEKYCVAKKSLLTGSAYEKT